VQRRHMSMSMVQATRYIMQATGEKATGAPIGMIYRDSSCAGVNTV